MDDTWKDVIGYEGLYTISNTGEIKSLRRNRIIKSWVYSKYYIISLSNNNVRRTLYLHRLIANHFIPNPENKTQVNHIDGNKLNNSISNLEWVTCSENIKHAYDIGLIESHMKGKTSKLHHNSKPVYQYDRDGLFINEYDSCQDASSATGISKGNICSCARGEKYRKLAGKFKWSYIKL
jgi:hypothetical protein